LPHRVKTASDGDNFFDAFSSNQAKKSDPFAAPPSRTSAVTATVTATNAGNKTNGDNSNFANFDTATFDAPVAGEDRERE